MNIITLSAMAMRYHYYSTHASSGVDGAYVLIGLVMILLPLIAHFNVTGTFSKYSNVGNSRGLTADEVARKILDANGLQYVGIERIPGKLTDHYDPRANVVRLSDSVYGKTSVAAIGVAAHECGHACQHAESYTPIVVRSKLVPFTNICSRLWYFVLVIGIIFSSISIGTSLIYLSIAMFSAVVVFQLVTLPCEFNASDRALQTLEQDNILELHEVPQARKVLRAAALTYVTSLVVSILQLIRLLAAAKRR